MGLNAKAANMRMVRLKKAFEEGKFGPIKTEENGKVVAPGSKNGEVQGGKRKIKAKVKVNPTVRDDEDSTDEPVKIHNPEKARKEAVKKATKVLTRQEAVGADDKVVHSRYEQKGEIGEPASKKRRRSTPQKIMEEDSGRGETPEV